MPPAIPALPASWSSLTWQQLNAMWRVKILYGQNPDIARVQALMSLIGIETGNGDGSTALHTMERVYRLYPRRSSDIDQRIVYTTTARSIAYMARLAIPWFDFPYGDQGDDEIRDDKGRVIKEARRAHHGYVSPLKDAMVLSQTEVTVSHRHFALPQAACNNLTWQQYRAIQSIAQQMVSPTIDDKQAIELQAGFMAHILTPRSSAVFDTSLGSVKFRPHYVYHYTPARAVLLTPFWMSRLVANDIDTVTLFYICFQVYQTSLVYFADTYPALFSSSGKGRAQDPLALEIGMTNSLMKYGGYVDQQAVYDSNLPFALSFLNAMAEDAKEIEKIQHKKP